MALYFHHKRKEIREWCNSLSTKYWEFQSKFQRMDHIGNGCVSRHVFGSILWKIALVSTRKCEDLCNYLDPDKTNRVPYKKFLEMIGSKIPKKTSSSYTLDVNAPKILYVRVEWEGSRTKFTVLILFEGGLQ